MLAAVNHPTIAAIYGAEQDGDTRYIVMELVEGETLAQRLSTGALPVADSLRIASQIAEALEVAHEKGVIHRDLKPANIKITPEAKVKVLDFGLAKAMELPFAGDMSRSPTLVMSDSRPGEIVGTPEFMSPEQARGKETDRRTDIWAFGCILFESLSGKRAFTGETVPTPSARSFTSSRTGRRCPPAPRSGSASCSSSASRRTRAAACATRATRAWTSRPRSPGCPARAALAAAGNGLAMEDAAGRRGGRGAGRRGVFLRQAAPRHHRGRRRRPSARDPALPQPDHARRRATSGASRSRTRSARASPT